MACAFHKLLSQPVICSLRPSDRLHIVSRHIFSGATSSYLASNLNFLTVHTPRTQITSHLKKASHGTSEVCTHLHVLPSRVGKKKKCGLITEWHDTRIMSATKVYKLTENKWFSNSCLFVFFVVFFCLFVCCCFFGGLPFFSCSFVAVLLYFCHNASLFDFFKILCTLESNNFVLWW